MPKVMEKGQVVIPIKLRRRYGLSPGSQVIVEPVKSGVLVKPAEDIIKELVGKYRGFGSTKDLLELRKEELRHEEEEYQQIFKR